MAQLQFTDATVFLVTLIVGLLALRSHRKAMEPIERQQVADLPIAELDWQPSRNVFEMPEQFGYQVYSRRYDVCAEAADLPAEPGLDDRLKLLGRIERSREGQRRCVESPVPGGCQVLSGSYGKPPGFPRQDTQGR